MTIAASTRDKIIQWQALKTPANANEQNLYDLLSVFSTYHSSLAQTTQLKLDQWLDDSIASLQSGGSGIGSSDFTQLNIAAAGLEYNPWSLSMRQMIAFNDYLDLLLGGGYADDVLATSPLAYWQLNETSGTTIVDSSGNGYDGEYTGVTLAADTTPQGTPAPFWDGSLDYGNVHSAGFASAFDLDEFTIMLWLKVNSAAVWTDGVRRFHFRFLRDASNDLFVRKDLTANSINLIRAGGGTTKIITYTESDTDWFSIAVSCSISGGGLLNAGDLRGYSNGAQVGTTQTGNIASTGSGLDAIKTVLGMREPVKDVWHGFLGHAIVWNRPMDNDILSLMTVS